MPHLSPLADAQAQEAVQETFRSLHAKFGKVPNFFRTLGHAPAVLNATLALNQAIQQDLDPKLRELAYLKTSQLNQCGYCVHYHQALGRKVGLSDQQIRELEGFEQSGSFTDQEKAVLRFSEQWTCQGKVEANVMSQLSASLSPAHLVTLAATVGLANWCNRFNVTFGVELP